MGIPASHFTWSFLLYFISMATTQDIVKYLNFPLIENLKAGTFIGDIAGESNIGTEDGKTFTILTDSNKNLVETLVILNSTTGKLTTATTVDREKVCPFERECIISFDVVVSATDLYVVINIHIDIVDANDNTPKFAEKEVRIEIPESKSNNSIIPLPNAATDLDQGENNGVYEYAFSPFSTNTNKFGLKIERNPDVLNLVLISELDHEKMSSYELLILAKDNGIPLRTGTLTVSVIVLDENDNKPVFVNSIVNVTVTEDIDIGKSIVTLKAKDADSGANGEIEYHLEAQQTADILDSFAIGQTSGEVTVIKKLDYEPGNSDKVISIVARDKGDTPKSTLATLYLTIVDAGNNPPEISLTYLVPEVTPHVIEVEEDYEDAVAHVNVIDTDTGLNGNFTCQTYNTYFGLNQVTGMTSVSRKGYKVFVQHPLDREYLDKHNVTVTCVDGGDLEKSVWFIVKVKDVNDNSPKFSEYIYTTDINENNTYGAEIVTVSATDKDVGNNGRISFKINPNEPASLEFFEVEEFSGVIRAKKALDREKYAQKIFTVLAIDHGSTPRTSTATIMLNVMDINDMRPTFTKTVYVFQVRENRVSGTSVDNVTAVDEDQGDNKKLGYYLMDKYKEGGASRVPFDVFSDGRIFTNEELDREIKGLYEFEIGVRDAGSPSLNNSVFVQVKVLDVNDETPKFSFPSLENHTVTALNAVSDTPIALVQGHDNDTGINQQLMYFIVEGDNHEIFTLDSNSGKLSIIKYIHLTEDKLYKLYLSVHDKGQPSLSSNEYLDVMLRYTNETGLAAVSDESNSYVIIVITVVCITVILSATIITVICIIRRRDITKCGSKSLNIKIPSALRIGSKGSKRSPGQQLASDTVYPETLQPKNKKEVSFSIEDGDSFSSNDFKMALTSKDKALISNRQPVLNSTPEEPEDLSSKPPISILRTAQPYGQSQPVTQQFVQSQSKFLDSDMPLGVNHQREDSHSETSGETATSHDSGNGGSLEGDNHDAPRTYEFNPLNTAVYIIKPESSRKPVPSQVHMAPASPDRPVINKTDFQRPGVVYSDHLHNSLPNNPNNLPKNPNSLPNYQNRTNNWCKNYHDSNSSYPDSDYLSSLGSMHNCSKNNSYIDPKLTWGHHSNNNSKLSNIGYINHGYGSAFPNISTNSTRDDDETTTTSGSYTINHDDLEDDLSMAQVV